MFKRIPFCNLPAETIIRLLLPSTDAGKKSDGISTTIAGSGTTLMKLETIRTVRAGVVPITVI